MADSNRLIALNARGWRLLVVVLMLALTLPRLWHRGMFLDGVTYAVVARNMAMGTGSFWVPSFSATTYAQFFEQPPLGMALQAIAFLVFGDHFFVERLYSMVVFGLNAWLIVALWRRLMPAEYDWLPVLLWLAPSVVTWSVVNNMLEPTQAVFTSLACYAILRTGAGASRRASGLWAGCAAVSIAAAVLVKGPVGLFPLAVPVLFFVLQREYRPTHPRVVWTVFATVAAVLAASLAAYGPAQRTLAAFTTSHLVPVLAGDRGVGRLGADLARHVTLGIGLRMAVLVAGMWIFRRRKNPGVWRGHAAAWYFATAVAASLPILVSPVLVGHYFFPSTPFFALGFAALALPAVSSFRSRPGSRSWRAPVWLAASLVAAAVVLLITRGPLEVRSRALIRDLDVIRSIAPIGQTIGACPASAQDWGLLSFMQRFYRISLRSDGAPASGWFLMASGGCALPSACRVVDAAAPTTEFTLLQCAASPKP